MLVALLRLVLPRKGWRVQAEVPLAKEPLRLDALVVRRLQRAPLPEVFRPEIERFGKFTLVHFVSPADEIEGDDVLALLAYACQFVRLEGIAIQGQVVLFVVCSSLTPRYLSALEKLEGRLAKLERGFWQGALAGFPLWVVETRKRSEQGGGERLWYTLSRAFLEQPQGLQGLSEEELYVYRQLQRYVQRFETEGDELMAREVQKMQRSFHEATRKLLEDIPVKDRLAGIPAEQRLEGLTPEQRLTGLDEAQRQALLELLLAGPKPARAKARRAPARSKAQATRSRQPKR